MRTFFIAWLAAWTWLFIAVEPALAQPPAQEPAEEAQPATDEDIEALIRVLEDDAARTRLIERLRAEAVAAEAAPADATAPFLVNAQDTLARELARYTRGVAERATDIVAHFNDIVAQIGDLVSGEVPVNWQALGVMATNVALVVAATFGAYVLLQLLLKPVYRRMAEGMAADTLLMRTRTILFGIMLDVSSVVLAWMVGSASSLFIGAVGEMGINQSFFLTAFLVVELAKAATRGVLSPRWARFRIWRMEDTTAAYWYFWLSRLVSIVGYTFLFIAPVLAANISVAVAEAARIVILFTALALASLIILQSRNNVGRALMRRAERGRKDSLSRFMASIAGIWHVLAIVYLITVFVLWLADHEAALPFVLEATVRSLLAIAIGVALGSFVTRLASGGLHLPPDLRQRLPLLEHRLNAYVPNVLRVVRAVVTLGVVLTIVQVWGLVDVAGWLTTDVGQRVLTSIVAATFIALVGLVIHLAVQAWVEYRLNPSLGLVPTPRERTLLSLFRNAFTIALAVVVVMLVLAQLGMNIGPLLAGAGVLGLAIGFGAQKLVQDIINGVFIQFENTMNEGDVVTAGGITGVVERLTVRSVSLRSLDGTYHVIPFSSVDSVSNLMKHFSYHVAAIGVAYRERIPEVKQAMVDAFDALKETELGVDIMDELDMQGVTEFANSAVVVRARIKTAPGKQWAIGRLYNEIIKEIFDERDIEIPFPHMTLYMGQDKDGNAAPMRIESSGSTTEAPPPSQRREGGRKKEQLSDTSDVDASDVAGSGAEAETAEEAEADAKGN